MGAIDFSINEKLLSFLRTQLDLKWFMETGTFEGTSLAIASRHFPKCLSVELSPTYYEKALTRFKESPSVELHFGSSPEILKKLAPSFALNPGLYWLDAHWCVAENTAGSDSQSPLLGELQAIDRIHPRSVVLIDDARLYLCAPPNPHRYQDWPGFSEIVRLLNNLSDTHTLSVYNDVIAFYPKSIAKEFDRFAYENGVDWLNLVLSQRELAATAAAVPPPHPPKRSLWKRLRRKLGLSR
jgi:hypothetical protein